MAANVQKRVRCGENPGANQYSFRNEQFPNTRVSSSTLIEKPRRVAPFCTISYCRSRIWAPRARTSWKRLKIPARETIEVDLQNASPKRSLPSRAKVEGASADLSCHLHGFGEGDDVRERAPRLTSISSSVVRLNVLFHAALILLPNTKKREPRPSATLEHHTLHCMSDVRYQSHLTLSLMRYRNLLLI